MKPTVLLTSGYMRETVERLRDTWRVVDIEPHGDALEYLKGCDRLPECVVIGYVPRMGSSSSEAASSTFPEALAAPAMLRRVLGIDADLPVLVSASEKHPRRIVELVKKGAFGYVVEPRDKSDARAVLQYTDELELLVTRAIRWRQTILENRRLQQSAEQGPDSLRLVFRSSAMNRVVQLAAKVAPTPATVLLTGESGTGKDLLAKRIHQDSARATQPFVAINCGAMNEHLLTSELFGHVKGAFTGADSHSPGLIRQAGEGTLMLDEVEAISPAFQVMLLRVIEERIARPVGGQKEYPVRCRFIAASNSELESLVARGAFRRDLYYRLNVFRIDLPPLRRRIEDIPLLAAYFLQRTADEFGRAIHSFDPAAMELLEGYSWPGNIRELRNVIERAIVLCEGDRIRPADVAGYVTQVSSGSRIEADTDYATAMAKFERRLLQSAVERANGNVASAARRLAMKRTTLRYRLGRLGLDGKG